MVGQKVGRYEVIRELGRGGMAVVFLARDPAFGRQVAIKLLPPQFTYDPQFRERFQREAKVIATLEHSYIVPVYDYGEEGDQPFIVMRHMSGGTLADRMAGKPMPLSEIVPIVGRLAEALDEAHNRGIVHRDLKPSNVMFDGHGHAFLSDFGIAKMLEASVALTGSGVIGTPAYMSPEQAVGERTIDRRSDIYSLGVMLYEMLAGHHPYEADTPMRLMLKHVTEPVPQLGAAEMSHLTLPPSCNPILARTLAKKPEDRYPTAGAVAEDVRVLSGITPPLPGRPGPAAAEAARPSEAALAPATHPAPTAPPVSQTTRPVLRLPPRRWLIGGAGVTALIAVVGLALFLSVGGGGEPTPSATPTLASTLLSTPAPGLTLVPPATELSATAHVEIASPTQTSPPSSTSTATPTSSPLPDTPTTVPLPTATRRPATRPPPTATATPVPPPSNTPIPLATDTPRPPPPPTDTVAPPATNTPPPVEPPTSTPIT